jgi:hypothetical protein
MTATRNRKPGVPQVPPTQDRTMHAFNTALKEHVEVAQGVRGRGNDRYVTLGMLLELGIITQDQANQINARF